LILQQMELHRTGHSGRVAHSGYSDGRGSGHFNAIQHLRALHPRCLSR